MVMFGLGFKLAHTKIPPTFKIQDYLASGAVISYNYKGFKV
jgi:hypothetical protein